MQKIRGWKSNSKKLGREFIFKDFKNAMDFVNAVANIAESENHHPDIHIYWNKVRLELTTHSSGKVTQMDFKMAAKINAAALALLNLKGV